MVKKLGFEPIRQKGAHIRFKHPDGRKTTIPDHGNQDVPYGLLIRIVKNDLEMNMETFFQDK